MGIYTNSYQGHYISIFYGTGAKPLNMWDTHIKDGYMIKFLDPQLKAAVLEIGGVNVSTTYMVCPKGNKFLGIVNPFLVMIVKNLKKYFTFEVTIRDHEGVKRRFRASNFQSSTSITSLSVAMPIGLADGWNQIQFNLAEFTYKAFNKYFTEVLSLKINANICVRRIYFAKSLVPEDELPNEYRLFCQVPRKPKDLKPHKDDIAHETSKADLETAEAQLTQETNALIEKVKEASLRNIKDFNEMTAAGEEPVFENILQHDQETDTRMPPVAEINEEPVKDDSQIKQKSRESSKQSIDKLKLSNAEASSKTMAETIQEPVKDDSQVKVQRSREPSRPSINKQRLSNVETSPTPTGTVKNYSQIRVQRSRETSIPSIDKKRLSNLETSAISHTKVRSRESSKQSIGNQRNSRGSVNTTMFVHAEIKMPVVAEEYNISSGRSSSSGDSALLPEDKGPMLDKSSVLRMSAPSGPGLHREALSFSEAGSGTILAKHGPDRLASPSLVKELAIELGQITYRKTSSRISSKKNSSDQERKTSK